MELIIDDNFKETFKMYYGNMDDDILLDNINATFAAFDPEVIVDAVNIVKTARVLGMTYTECCEKVVETIRNRFPVERDINKFVFNIVFKSLITSGVSEVEDLLQKPRDILREIAAKHFRVRLNKVTDEMMAVMDNASRNFQTQSYSVDEPPTGSWDEYYYNVCKQVARNSKCLSRRIGAVLVQDKSIISTGYNGPPRGVPRCDVRWRLDKDFAEKYGKHIVDNEFVGICPRRVIGFKSGEGLDVCPAGHAERNALINAARNGICTRDTSLYMTCGIPCTPCLVEIINAGVREIVVGSLHTYDSTAMYLLNQSKLSIRMFDFIK